jgi:hypothetical protein
MREKRLIAGGEGGRGRTPSGWELIGSRPNQRDCESMAFAVHSEEFAWGFCSRC